MQTLSLTDFMIAVRDNLRDALGDHMVASTVFAKSIRTISVSWHTGMSIEETGRALWNIDFAGSDDYEN